LWPGSLTPWSAYLTIFGISLLPTGLWLLFSLVPDLHSKIRLWYAKAVSRKWRWSFGILLVLYLLIDVTDRIPLLWVIGPVMVLVYFRWRQDTVTYPEKFILLLVSYGTILSVIPEFFTVRGDIGRMNTVFKLYYQSGLLLGLGGGIAQALLWRGMVKAPVFWGRSGRLMAVMLLFAGLLYVPVALFSRATDRMVAGLPWSLNGTDFMRKAEYRYAGKQFALQPDFAAITWIQEHISGAPVLAEGLSWQDYSWGGRVSVYTGLPTILGWVGHQYQQHSTLPAAMLGQRKQDIEKLYKTLDPAQAMIILRRYHVQYIYVGALEAAVYPDSGLRKFDRMVSQGLLRLVYQNVGVKLYHVTKLTVQ